MPFLAHNAKETILAAKLVFRLKLFSRHYYFSQKKNLYDSAMQLFCSFAKSSHPLCHFYPWLFLRRKFCTCTTPMK